MKHAILTAFSLGLALTATTSLAQADRTDSFIVRDVQTIATNGQNLRVKGQQVMFRDNAGERNLPLGQVTLVVQGVYGMLDSCLALASATGPGQQFIVRIRENSFEYDPRADAVIIQAEDLRTCVLQK